MHRLAVLAVLVAVSAGGCGRYEPPSDRPDLPEASATWSDGTTITRCEDVPPLPTDQEVSPGWGTDGSGALMSLLWVESSGTDEKFFEFIVRVDDPSCDKRPDIRKLMDVNAEPPRFEDARIVVRPGEDRAYVGYTIIDDVSELFASQEGITATRADGRSIEWKHQTATGGPSEIGAEGRLVVEPADDVGPYTDVGDAYYFDSAGLKIGETITVTFRFVHVQDVIGGSTPATPRAVVKVPFRVVAAG